MAASDETGMLPLNLHEYEAAARARLPPMVWDYVAGGSGDEVTLRANRAAFARWRLLPRVLRGIAEVSTATSVLGQAITLPIEEVAPETGPWWFQLFISRDRERTREVVSRAVASGASALVLTVDPPVRGRREAEERAHFTMPPVMPAVLLAPPETGPRSRAGQGSVVAKEVDAVFDAAIGWRDLDWLASLSPLPILIKGILHPDDAVRAVDGGARAILVSNHGGRQLDSAVAALDALPAVVDAVAGRVEVLVDGGVRRGTDVVKALALGAQAVLLGRPVQWGLAVGGEAGVRQVLELLRAEVGRDLLL